MRTRAVAMSSRSVQEGACAACGGPLDEDGGVRAAGVRMHPGRLPAAPAA